MYNGCCNNRQKKKYTNGKISKFFFPRTEPEGWVLGCTKEYSEKQQQSTIKKWKEEDYRAKQKDTRSTTTYKNKIKQEKKIIVKAK